MILTSLLPAPKHAQHVEEYLEPVVTSTALSASKSYSSNVRAIEPPKYGRRHGFKPTSIADFGDGGAFPEVHMKQFPLDMGRKDKVGVQSKVTNLQVDSDGNIKYDVILKSKMRKDFNVATSYTDLMEKHFGDDELAKPSLEVEMGNAEKTRNALGQLAEKQLAAAQGGIRTVLAKEAAAPTFIRYTPSNQGDAFNSGATQRIIKLQEMPVDPLDPPKFVHTKLPGGPPSPPVPIMHSPPRKVTAEDQLNWKIPPCISNWKNIKGYTIPLDKRLAADGRGLEEIKVNDKFASLSESLFVAERNARKEIEARAVAMKKIMKKQKDNVEDELRSKASSARASGKTRLDDRAGDDYDEASAVTAETEDEIQEREEREGLRKDRQRDIKREMRMERMSEKERKRQQAMGAREGERDVSEQIALGKAVPKNKDGMFDQRLFNQDGEGTQAGFGDDESFSAYDKPLFEGTKANYIYRNKKGDDEFDESDMAKLIEKSSGRFNPDKGFKGAAASSAASGSRDRPVAFEKEQEDPFGIGQMLTDAKKGNSLDKIGKSGTLGAAVRKSSEEYSRDGKDSQREMRFEESGRSETGKRRRRD